MKAGGICPSGLIEVFNLQYDTAPVELCFNSNNFPTGICSVETELSLRNDDLCFYETLETNPPMVANTIAILNATSCADFAGSITQNKSISTSKSRLNPLFEVGEKSSNGKILRTKLKFEHTKHRYPWICSLRHVIKEKLELGTWHDHFITIVLTQSNSQSISKNYFQVNWGQN